MRDVARLTLLLLAVTGPAPRLAWGQGPGSSSLAVKVVAQVVREAGERVEIDVDHGSVLRSGDGLQLRLRSSGDAYVYVIAFGASGRLQLLRPYSGESKKAFLPGGEEEVFPAEEVFLPLDDVTGQESLFVLAFPSPMKDLDAALRTAQAAGGADAAYAVLRARHPGVLRIDIRHIGRAPLVGLEFAAGAKVSAPPPPAAEAPASPAGRGGTVSIPLGQDYVANPALDRGGWLGAYEEEGVLSSAGSRIPSIVSPPTAVLPAAARQGPGQVGDAPAPGTSRRPAGGLRERLGRWFGKKPIDEAASGEDTPQAEEDGSYRPARGGDDG